MLTLLYSLLALVAIGLAVTACAAANAPEGYEDARGFHPTEGDPERTLSPAARSTAGH